jgi:hypothetical protein
MARYLSAEWFEEMEAALEATVAPAGAAAAGEGIVLRQVITGGPDGDVTYRVRVIGGRARLTRAPGAADATITTDYDTAAALHQGRLTLQDAFQSGRVKVDGNVATLVARQAVLADAGPFPTNAGTTV